MAEDFSTQGMLEIYLYENGQLLERLQEIVLEYKDEECFDEDSINEIFRAMHTIKGSSGVMMFDEVTRISHKLEDVFYYLRESKPDNVPHMELVEHVLQVVDFITSEMIKIEGGQPADGSAEDYVTALDAFLNKIKNGEGEAKKEIKENVYVEPQQFYIAPMASSSSRFYKIYLTFQKDLPLANVHAYKAVYSLKEIAEDLLHYPEDIISDESAAEEILENGFKILLQAQCTEEDIRGIIQEGYDIQKVDVYECSAKDFQQGFDSVGSEIRIDLDAPIEETSVAGGEMIIMAPATQEVTEKKPIAPGDFVIESKGPGTGKKLAKDKPKKHDKAAFMSVDIRKMDMLMDLIGELVIAESVVLQNPDLQVPGLKLDNFTKAARQMKKISSDLQNTIMSMRMVPLTNTFQKMNRIVFDVSRKLGKDIEFEMIGDQTEVDKNVSEHISDPLMHLVRNSVDHGIEMPDERAAAGKTEKGKITLSAKNESGKIWITVQDNGKGLDRAKILAKARKNELLDPYKLDKEYTDKEVFQLITLPGFSTKEAVTEYSGRGVGMDVVVSNLQAIGGSLEIESVLGQGSQMIMKIPLTLAIIDGIVMKVGKSAFVLETNLVKEFMRAQQDMLVMKPDGQELVMVRGECYPVLRVGEWYQLSDYKLDMEKAMFVLVEIEEQVICLVVDDLVGKQEIVVKPIPDYVKKVKGLSGCTQLGDGSIALILDVGALTK
ncbi:MAG: chemotaxis protein CheA [Lachnospiraceae bacterium]|nr:chemotaxis protein CheA [Lachnospiraceae bacterium]